MNVNPYDPPTANCEPTKKPFRCSLWKRVLLRLVAGRKREPRIDRATGEYELFQTGFHKVILFACLLSPLTLCIPAMIVGFRADLSAWLVGVLGAEAFAAFLWFARESVYFTDDYIRRFGPWRRNVQLTWAEVSLLKVNPDGDLVLADGQGRTIYVHNDLHGQHVLLTTIRRILRPELVEPIASDLRELEKLVC